MSSGRYTVLIALLLISQHLAADANAWKSRTIYQLLTDRYWRSNGDTQTGCNLSQYCGGDWAGITQQLQYIKDLGFDAIWISPVVDNIEPGYHGYWARNWEKVNSHFGDENSLKAFVDAAHSMGIWVMVDVVANHVGPVGDDFSQIYPLNQPYHYHKDCDINDWNNQWQVENCRLAGLPDIDQSQSWVRQYLKDWIKNLVTKYGFDGIRIDTVPEVEKNFWAEYSQSAGVYSIGEVFNGNDAYVGPYQNYIDATLNYGMYFSIKDTFGSGSSMYEIKSRWDSINANFKNPDLLGLFVDNHDNPRYLNQHNDWRTFKSALAFSLTARGIPIMYYGSEQGYAGGADPNNREPLWNNMNKNHEIYRFVQTVNQARHAQGAPSQPFAEKWVDDNMYAYTRGRFFVAVTNKPYMTVSNDVPNTGFSEGETVCNVFNSSDCTTIRSGKLSVSLNNGEVKIYIPKSSSFFSSKRKHAREILLN